jgi:hypothetical protein
MYFIFSYLGKTADLLMFHDTNYLTTVCGLPFGGMCDKLLIDDPITLVKSNLRLK